MKMSFLSAAEILTELTTVMRKSQHVLDTVLLSEGLTVARSRVLLALSKNRALNQKSLAQLLRLEQASIVRRLNSLEMQNLVKRIPVPEDRRSNQVTLTPSGEEKAQLLSMFNERLRHRILENIQRDALVTAIAVLKQITSNAEAAVQKTAPAKIKDEKQSKFPS